MAYKIKYPTLITSELPTHHQLPEQMVDDLRGEINAYNRRGADEKVTILFRGKSKVKIIKSIDPSYTTIGRVPCVLICVQEYKMGQEDLYVQKEGTEDEDPIHSNDHIGSNKNYALLYPLVDLRAVPGNKWLVIIYDTPGKEDTDIVNTIKNVVNKIFHFPFRYVVPMAINHQQVVPKIEVTISKVENVDNDQYILHNLIVNSSSKSTKKIVYANINGDCAEEILNDRSDVDTRTKKVIKFFHDALNPSAYTTYTVTSEEDGVFNTIMTTKYSEYDDVEPADFDNMHDQGVMIGRFTRVLSNYLSNGINGQGRPAVDGHNVNN